MRDLYEKIKYIANAIKEVEKSKLYLSKMPWSFDD